MVGRRRSIEARIERAGELADRLRLGERCRVCRFPQPFEALERIVVADEAHEDEPERRCVGCNRPVDEFGACLLAVDDEGELRERPTLVIVLLDRRDGPSPRVRTREVHG